MYDLGSVHFCLSCVTYATQSFTKCTHVHQTSPDPTILSKIHSTRDFTYIIRIYINLSFAFLDGHFQVTLPQPEDVPIFDTVGFSCCQRFPIQKGAIRTS